MSSVAELASRITTDSGDEAAWNEIFRVATEERQIGTVLQILTTRHVRRKDGASYAHRMILWLLGLKAADTVMWLAEAIPNDSAFFPIFLYGKALVEAANWQLDQSSANLRRAIFFASQTISSVFNTDSYFAEEVIGEMLQQANLVEPINFQSAGSISSPEILLPDRLPKGNGPVFVASCDDVYFQAYGLRFLSSLFASCPEAIALINRVNPTELGNSLEEEFRSQFDKVVFATEVGKDLPVYYASNRFLISDAIMNRYGVDIIISDIDSEFPIYFDDIVSEMAKSSIVYIGRPDRILPTLVIDACLIGIHHDEIGRRFLKNTADYLQRKLAEEMPLWTVDQVALFRARCLEQGAGCVNINEILNSKFLLPDSIKAAHIVERKNQLAGRGGPLHYDIHFDENRRPMMTPKKATQQS